MGIDQFVVVRKRSRISSIKATCFENFEKYKRIE